jgi:hypothetical protein
MRAVGGDGLLVVGAFVSRRVSPDKMVDSRVGGLVSSSPDMAGVGWLVGDGTGTATGGGACKGCCSLAC